MRYLAAFVIPTLMIAIIPLPDEPELIEAPRLVKTPPQDRAALNRLVARIVKERI